MTLDEIREVIIEEIRWWGDYEQRHPNEEQYAQGAQAGLRTMMTRLKMEQRDAEAKSSNSGFPGQVLAP